MKLDANLTPYRKIDSKWIKDLHRKKLKLLKENIGINLCGLRLGNNFSNMTPKSQATKEKIDKLNLLKIKSLRTLSRKWKENPQNVIFVNYISDKSLVSRILDKELLSGIRNSYKSIIKRHIAQIINGQRVWIDISPLYIYMLMANKHMKRCWTSFVLRGMQIKITMKHTY